MQFPGRNTYAAVYPVVNGWAQPESIATPGKGVRNMRWHVLRLFPQKRISRPGGAADGLKIIISRGTDSRKVVNFIHRILDPLCI